MTEQGKRPNKLTRRTVLGAMVMAPVAGAAVPLIRAAAATDPAVVGQWAAPFSFGGIAIHATLMYNDDVLFFQYPEGSAATDHTSYIGTWNWKTNVVREAPVTFNRDIFCSGQSFLADGRVFISGGHAHSTGKKQDPVGVADTCIYNPITRVWTETAFLGEKRWYPTNVYLPNGKTLVFGGTKSAGVQSPTVDEYTASTNTMRTLPSTANKVVGMYPRTHLLANGKILKSGHAKTSLLFDPATNRWTNSASMSTARSHGTVALLPGAMKVLTAGGGAPLRTAETLDLSEASPRWRATGSLNHARMLSNSVVLPDGQVLVIGGGQAFKYTNPQKIPELYNPATGVWTDMAPQQAGRMYHATAVLLPDGRVLSAGQDSGSLAKFAEIYSPPYLFKGTRPTVSGTPATIAIGGQVQFTCSQAASLSKVVLIRAGSNTHEIDSEQRTVPLSFTTAGSTVLCRGSVRGRAGR